VAAPSSRLERQIGFLVGSRLGASTDWVLYDRSTRTPMNFTLDHAERALGADVQVVWVFGGYPELFTLTALERPIVVFSERYLELTAYFRALFMEGYSGEVRTEVARSQCLTLASELALLAGSPDLAVRLFLRAKLGTGIYVASEGIIKELETAPIDETYMIAWFFGLLHEVGHSAPEGSKPRGPLFTDEALEAEIQNQIEAFSDDLERDIRPLVEEVRGDNPSHQLSPTHLRSEIEADIFATGVLLQATLAIRAENGTTTAFDALGYIAEVYVYLNVITLVRRCRETVRWASEGQVRRSELAAQALEPLGIAVRLVLVRRYLSAPLALYFAGGDPAQANVDGWSEAIDKVMGGFSEETAQIEPGLGEAMELALWDTEPLEGLLVRAASEQRRNPVFNVEAGSLLKRGRALGLDSAAFAALAQLAS
jgi:hypothetical protein